MIEPTVLARYGPQLIFVNVLLDQAGVPLPAVPLLLACGALAATGEISPVLLLLTATLASLTADSAWFTLGRWQGRRVLRLFSRLSLHPDEPLAKVERSLRHHGLASIALAKFVPGLQTVAPPLAGALGISMVRFVLVSTLSGLAWASGLVGIGWFFRDTINEVTQRIEALGVWALVLVVLLLSGYVAFVWWRRRRGSVDVPRRRPRSGGDRIEAAQPGSHGQALRSRFIEDTAAAGRPRLLRPTRRTP
jgi:membrane protein DedA with SNARE-associated domain